MTHPVLRGFAGAVGFLLWYCLVVSVVPLYKYAWSGQWPSDLVTPGNLSLHEMRRILQERGLPTTIDKRGVAKKADFERLIDMSGTVDYIVYGIVRKMGKII